ncbi:MAG: HAD hydrolase-like protein, partial [Megasphaera micronuciformis]|nr:HAD hydrolase-like protein [Megasphaera micronuciformis]
YCPYLEGATVAAYDRKSSWRKPEPGMILQAFADYDIDKKKSFLVGDSPRDIEAAERAGLDGYLFSGGSLKTFVDGILKERNVDGAI